MQSSTDLLMVYFDLIRLLNCGGSLLLLCALLCALLPDLFSAISIGCAECDNFLEASTYHLSFQLLFTLQD